MNFKKVASFSLLAYINDSSIGVNTFEDIFIPIVKSSLCRMQWDGFQNGKSTMEIKKYVDQTYALDIPVPLLRTLLEMISNEVNNKEGGSFTLYQDGSFQISSYIFSNYEEVLNERELELEEVNKLYNTFLESNNLNPTDEPSIFDYIDQSRLSLSKYFAYKEDKLLEVEFVHQANFINSVKQNKKIYEILRRVYLGSIMSAYLEVEIGVAGDKLELVLDTNFIIGILDLNSEESTHTCRKILEIVSRLGYTASVLPFTLEETKMLIDRKALQLEGAFFQGFLDPESIYNAAKRKGLSKTQLQQIGANLEGILRSEYNVNLIANDDKYRNLAKYKYTEILEFYKSIRKTAGFSAHHDATAIAYVKEKRDIRITYDNIFKAKCWFVTNTHQNVAIPGNDRGLPEIIRADDMLNVLWLSNPNVTALVGSSELSVLGLTRLVSNTISYSLPSTRVLRMLDENFTKYGGTSITADDTLMVASMIARKQIVDVEGLTKVDEENPINFINTVKQYAEHGREEEKKLQESMTGVLKAFEELVKVKQDEKAEKENTLLEKEEDYKSKILALESDNKKLKNILILGGIIVLSMTWWTFDNFFFTILMHGLKNYWLVKLAGQLLMIALSAALFNNKYRTVSISATVALTTTMIALLKR